MVTGKMANDALSSLLSDSLASMGVEEKKSSAPMRKASSGPVPSSSYSPTESIAVPPRHPNFSKSQSAALNIGQTGGSNNSSGRPSPYGSYDRLDDLLGSASLKGAAMGPLSMGLSGGSNAGSMDDIFGAVGSSGPSTPTAAQAQTAQTVSADDFFGLGGEAEGPPSMQPAATATMVPAQTSGDIFDLDALNPSPASPAVDDLLGGVEGTANPYTVEPAALPADDFVILPRDADEAEPSGEQQPAAPDDGGTLEELLGSPGQEAQPNAGVAAEDDLLGMFSADGDAPEAPDAGQDRGDQGFTSLEDLLGATGGSKAGPSSTDAGAAAPPSATPQVIDDIFGATHQPSVCDGGAADFGMGVGGATAAGSMPGGPSLQREEIDPNEPEYRKELREKRIRGVQQRMAQALEEARERETIDAMEKAERSELAQYLGPKLEAWSKGKGDNIRALLSTLQDVIWDGSNWKEVSMMDLMNPAQVKKSYRKAMIIMHPDKVKQRGGTTEQIFIADYLFDLTNQAWGHFQQTEM